MLRTIGDDDVGDFMIGIFLIDDSADFLAAATRFLRAQPGIQILGQALSVRGAVPEIRSVRPDVVLLDWLMPDTDGLAALPLLKAIEPAPRVIVLTIYDDSAYRFAAYAHGADDFICKRELCDSLAHSLERLFPTAPRTPDGCRQP